MSWRTQHDEGPHHRRFWTRDDGAYVTRGESSASYTVNPRNSRSRTYVAFVPGIGWLMREENRPRKWGTPEAAMAAADREHPVKEPAGETTPVAIRTGQPAAARQPGS